MTDKDQKKLRQANVEEMQRLAGSYQGSVRRIPMGKRMTRGKVFKALPKQSLRLHDQTGQWRENWNETNDKKAWGQE
jgi:hypothetical protein